MFKKTASYFSALVLAIMLSACATTGTSQGEMEIRAGVVEQISFVELQSNHHAGVGAVVGGVAGLGIGSLIGRGSGRDVAMVLGTIGGAFAGNEVQKNYDRPIQGQQVIVRTRNGVLVSVTQPINPNIFQGQRVFIQGSGDGARVVAR